MTPKIQGVTIRWLYSEVIYVAKRTTGIVRWFDGSKGYGYIDAEDGEDVFVHHLDIVDEKTPFLSQGEVDLPAIFGPVIMRNCCSLSSR